MMLRLPQLPVLTALSLLLLLVMAVAASVGAVSIPLPSLLSGGLSESQLAVLAAIRLPRLFTAVVVGAALAVSGAAMQALFRNPLADPGLIGISSGAAFTVAVVIVTVGQMSGIAGLYGMSAAAFVGGLLSCLVIFKLAGVAGAFSVTYILLAGIAINALAMAGTGFLIYLSSDEELRTLIFWTMGSFGGALWPSSIVAATVVIPATLLLIRRAGQLNVLLLGEQQARHLGVDSGRLRRTVIICVALSVGAAVSVSGIIGFVGLVVPHLIRLSIGPDNRLLLPASALSGAMLMLAADTAARTVVAPAEMPVGILTALIGGPFFLWLLTRRRSGRFGL